MKYWDPITASIDWCEINYEVTGYVVEFWNTLSSFSFVLIGLVNLYLLKGLKGTAKENFISVLYILLGLGSAAFHGTLKFTYQLWDEIPMVWTISAALYSYITLKPRTAAFQWTLFIFFIFYNVFWMVIHSDNAFVVPFQVNFVLMYFSMVWQMYKYQKEIGNTTSARVLYVHTCVIVTACVSWLLDHALCEAFNTNMNPQMHAWWHVFMSLGAHYALTFEIVLRHSMEKRRVSLGGKFVLFPELDKHSS